MRDSWLCARARARAFRHRNCSEKLLSPFFFRTSYRGQGVVRMLKVLTPRTVCVVLWTGFSLNWLKGDQPHKAAHRLTAQEMGRTEAALRHKHYQPSHWRALVLQHQ